MDDPRWLRLITIGLVLAALAIGYFLLTGRLASSTAKTASQVTTATPSPSSLPKVVSTPTPSPIPTSALDRQTASSAYTRVVNRDSAQGQIQVLPKTGFPVGLTAALSVSVIISGWGLRKFPH